MSRIDIQKTYKIFIGGKFPRTESGRYYAVSNGKEQVYNMCLSSRKDFRNAVVVARKAQGSWAKASALNKGQILYRIAEMLEGRKAQFVAEIMAMGGTKKQAESEVDASIDRLVYYAGWSDKYQQMFSTVNPVASPHFNFSSPEPMGVVAIVAPEDQGLLGLVSTIAPVILSGNTCIVLASEQQPLNAISFAEVLNTSDVPAGVVNILTGKADELLDHMASHMDVNALVLARNDEEAIKKAESLAANNLKRCIVFKKSDWTHSNCQSPYFIEKTLEIKTTWHPTSI